MQKQELIQYLIGWRKTRLNMQRLCLLLLLIGARCFYSGGWSEAIKYWKVCSHNVEKQEYFVEQRD